MTYKPRDLGAALGRSIPNEGRVVIYKPKNQKGNKMAFGRSRPLGKPITDYDLTIPQKQISDDIRTALRHHFSTYGGIDSYGRTNTGTQGYTLFEYPADTASNLLNPTPLGPVPTELVGAFGDFYRMPKVGTNPTSWVKKAQIDELLQSTVDKNVQRIVTKAISSYLSANQGQKMAAIVNNITGVTATITGTAKVLIAQDPWFQSWRLTVS